jgi:Holliday junction resolvase RusA-like endonuclease
MNAVFFTIHGEAVAKGRAKAARRGSFITMYTPKKTVDYELLVAKAAKAAMGGLNPMEGAVHLTARIYRAIPQSWSLKKQRAAAMGEILPISKPDTSNIIKAIEDGANGILWKDDSQIVDTVSSKRYGTPRVEVEVRAL